MVIHFEICVVYYLPIFYKAKKVTRLNFCFVSLFVCQSFALFSSVFCQQLRYIYNRIVKIMKVYIERNSLQVGLIRYSKKMLTLFTLFLLSDGFNAKSPTERK